MITPSRAHSALLKLIRCLQCALNTQIGSLWGSIGADAMLQGAAEGCFGSLRLMFGALKQFIRAYTCF